MIIHATCPCGGKIPIQSFRGKFRLPKHESEVADLLASGLSAKQIAFASHRGLQTIRNYAHRIYNKVGVDNQLGLFLYAARAELREVGL